MSATYTFYGDWNNDGDFSDTGEDITGRVLERMDVTVTVGRDQARLLSPPAPGEMHFLLDNQSKDYSPENTSSPLAGNVKPGRQVYAKATLSAVDYALFRGHTDDYEVLPNRMDRSVRLSCLDPLAKLKGVRITTDLYRSVQTGAAIGYVLDAVGWSTSLRDLDYGATTVPWFWCDDDDAYDTVKALVDSEGPGALLTVDTDGKIVFRDRHHRLTAAASTTSQVTLRDTGTEPLYSEPLLYDHGWKDIVNSVTFNVPVRAVSGDLTAVWSTQGQISLSDGETIPVAARASTPFFGAVTPVAGTDYQLLSGTVTMTLSRTTGQSTTVFITASGGPAVVADLQVRAYAVSTVTTRVVTVEDSTSIDSYGRRSLPSDRDPVWAGLHDAEAIANLILAQRSERLPTVTVSVRGGNDTRLTQQLTRDLSDRITIVNDEMGLSADFYIEQIRHRITSAGFLHITDFGCEKVPDQPTGLLVLDDAALGLLNTGKLGGIVPDAPGTLFVLDDASLGVLGTGRIAY